MLDFVPYCGPVCGLQWGTFPAALSFVEPKNVSIYALLCWALGGTDANCLHLEVGGSFA